jgi:hypothetical protein
MKHTKIPWMIGKDRHIVGDDKDIAVCIHGGNDVTSTEADENAEFIVICCNNFQRMIDSLDSAVKVVDILLEESRFTLEQKIDIKKQSDKIKRTIASFDF